MERARVCCELTADSTIAEWTRLDCSTMRRFRFASSPLHPVRLCALAEADSATAVWSLRWWSSPALVANGFCWTSPELSPDALRTRLGLDKFSMNENKSKFKSKFRRRFSPKLSSRSWDQGAAIASIRASCGMSGTPCCRFSTLWWCSLSKSGASTPWSSSFSSAYRDKSGTCGWTKFIYLLLPLLIFNIYINSECSERGETAISELSVITSCGVRFSSYKDRSQVLFCVCGSIEFVRNLFKSNFQCFIFN